MIVRIVPWARVGRKVYASEMGYLIKELPPIGQLLPNSEFIALHKQDLPQLASEYFNAIETGETKDWCLCLWRVHPEDVNVKDGHCRECGQNRKSHETNKEDEHQFRGKRWAKVDNHPHCPVHTKEGMLIHFFDWVFNR